MKAGKTGKAGKGLGNRDRLDGRGGQEGPDQLFLSYNLICMEGICSVLVFVLCYPVSREE